MYTTVDPSSYKLFFAVICYKLSTATLGYCFFVILFRCVKYDIVHVPIYEYVGADPGFLNGWGTDGGADLVDLSRYTGQVSR